MGDTFEKVKEEAKKAADKITDSDTYLGSDDEKENRQNEKGKKEPMKANEPTRYSRTSTNCGQ
jgi:hypothetical protein